MKKRPIQFRVWDIKSKTKMGNYSTDWVGSGIGNIGRYDIQPWMCMSLKGEIMHNDNMGGFVDSEQDDYLIQQFTGFKDKNNKEIYEGDIVKIITRTHAQYALVEFSEFEGAFTIENRILGEFIRDNDLVVIGNNIENVEFLKV